MSDAILHVSIPSDNDGFVSLECDFCHGKFKLTTEDFQGDDVIDIFCSHCGIPSEPNDLLTDEVLEQIQIVAHNHVNSMINGFMGDLEKSMRSNKYISFKAGNKLKMDDEKHLFEKEEMEITTPTCCMRPVKVDLLNLNIGIYCPFCGVQK